MEAKKANESLSSQIHSELLQKIQRGDIGPADRLVDIGIAKEMGVSRMPVREALLRLANDGYVVGTTRGFVLPTLDRQDIADIFEIRRLIEPRAAANAARDMSEADHERLRQAVVDAERAVATGDADGLALANVQFRQTWIGALANRRLAETLSRFSDQVQVVRAGTLSHPDTQQVVIQGLYRLRDAYLARDAMAAGDAMSDFLASAQSAFFADLDRQHADNE